MELPSQKTEACVDIDIEIKGLVEEAQRLFAAFDSISSSVCKLEKELESIKAYFPFKKLVKDEIEPTLRNPESCHIVHGCDVVGYRIKNKWFLSWEQDEKSPKFRLFLINEELELVYYNNIPECDPAQTDAMEYSSKCTFKKPLIETNLALRLEFSQYLIPFIRDFKAALVGSSLAIELSKLGMMRTIKRNRPSQSDDNLPF